MNRIDYKQTEISKKGRNGDKYLAHVAPGEMVVPPIISDDLRQQLHQEMIAAGLSPERYTVGSGMSINPETHLPEFFFKKIFKAVKKVISSPIGRIGIPLALSFTPLGPALGGALGATGTAASALGGGLIGAGVNALGGGGFKGALLGGLSGAGGGYLKGGGSVPGLGSLGGKLSGGGMGPPTPGTGVLGKIGGTLSGGGSSLFSGGGGSTLSNILSGVSTYQSQDDMEKELLKQQQRAESVISPYQRTGVAANNQLASRLSQGFSAPDLENDPGYQFQLEQGNKQLDRANAARGSFFSGAALKDAQTFGQGLADQTYNNAYQRWLSENQQLGSLGGNGQNAANSLAGVYGQTGLIGAGKISGQTNAINRTLAGVLGGGQRYVVGQRPDGTYIYSDEV